MITIWTDNNTCIRNFGIYKIIHFTELNNAEILEFFESIPLMMIKGSSMWEKIRKEKELYQTGTKTKTKELQQRETQPNMTPPPLSDERLSSRGDL
jgi:hypothetical protein